MSAERNAEPIPNATTRARFDSGRAMSGRIGISLASTVRSVIDVPPTHSSGVKLIWPAWTDAISSSVEAKSWPPADRMYASFGWTSTPGREPDRRHDDGDDEADARSAAGGARGMRNARAMPSAAFTSARSATTSGEPSAGMSRNGMITLPTIAPTVLTATSEPDSEPAWRASSDSSADDAGKAQAEHDGHRQDDEDRPSRSATAGSRAGARCEGLGSDDDRDEADHDESGDQDLRERQKADRVGDPRADEVEEQRPDREADEEDPEDDREHVRRVARPRGQQPRPQHLVAERRQAGDEGDRQGERPVGRRLAWSDASSVRRRPARVRWPPEHLAGSSSDGEGHDARRSPSSPHRRPAPRSVRAARSGRDRPPASR